MVSHTLNLYGNITCQYRIRTSKRNLNTMGVLVYIIEEEFIDKSYRQLIFIANFY